MYKMNNDSRLQINAQSQFLVCKHACCFNTGYKMLRQLSATGRQIRREFQITQANHFIF